MNRVRKWRAVRKGSREAAIGVNSGEDHGIGEFGLRPEFDPAGNLEHAQVSHNLNNLAEIEELRDDLRSEENELSRHFSPYVLSLGLLALFVIEAVASIQVIRALGYEGEERLSFGLMLAAFLFFITYLAANMGREAGSDQPEPGRRPAWFYVVLAAYGALVLAVTVVRVDEVAGEDVWMRADIAAGVVLLFATLGPAWLAELLMRQRVPAAHAHKTVRLLRRRLRRAERAHKQATTFVRRLARRGVAWDQEMAQTQALYGAAHRRTAAELTVAASSGESATRHVKDSSHEGG